MFDSRFPGKPPRGPSKSTAKPVRTFANGRGKLERITNYRERVFLVFPVETGRRVGRMSVRLALDVRQFIARAAGADEHSRRVGIVEDLLPTGVPVYFPAGEV